MISITEALILSTIPYNDTSLIVKAYTKDFGLQTYILRSARKVGGRAKVQHFQPLRILQLEISSMPKAKLHNIKSSSLIAGCEQTSSHIVKTSLAIFMAEVLNLSLKENTPNEDLYFFLKEQVISLEKASEASLPEFHLHFLIDLSTKLGFRPYDNYNEGTPFFDLISGKFTISTQDKDVLSLQSSFSFHNLLLANTKTPHPKSTATKHERRELADNLAKFYSIHITSGKMIRSHEILGVVLS